MYDALTTKLEIDITQAHEIATAMEMACVHKIPAVVVVPELIGPAIAQRIRRQANCKIIVPIVSTATGNWLNKLQHLPVEALMQDGFEILLTDGNAGSIQAEMSILTKFIKEQLSPVSEVRFTLNATDRGEAFVEAFSTACIQVPAINMVRTDLVTKAQQTKVNTGLHTKLVQLIRSKCARPIKVSGNISSAKACRLIGADRYAVNMKQAQSIINDLQKEHAKR